MAPRTSSKKSTARKKTTARKPAPRRRAPRVPKTIQPTTLGAVVLVGDDATVLGRLIASTQRLIDAWTIVDTSGAYNVRQVVEQMLAGHPHVTLERRPFVDFGQGRTEALQLAGGSADWLLMLDADMTVDAHKDFKTWLAGNPDPNVDAWLVDVAEGWGRYRLPLLTRGNLPWRYVGATHEALEVDHARTRSVTGLTVQHHEDGANRTHKFERDLALLKPAYDAGEPRATFYTAQTLRALGRNLEAIVAYTNRAAMEDTWEEERWYASYQAAVLAGDVEALLAVHKARPWRHEPLTAAARLTALRQHDDVLFNELA